LGFEITAQEKDGLSYWRVSDNGAFLGCCGLRRVRFTTDVTEVEMGFHLLPAAWGRGYASEAARAVVAYAFEQRGLDLLHAGHHPENVASRAVLLKLGFQRLAEDRFYPPTGLIHPWYRLPRGVSSAHAAHRQG
jgi:RimJ/RimL family protein N-acetyltransferase